MALTGPFAKKATWSQASKDKKAQARRMRVQRENNQREKNDIQLYEKRRDK